MEIIAKARYIRMTPRKVRLVAGLIRRMDIAQAEAQLGYSSKAAARAVLKLLRSAVANAENNFKLDRENLYVKSITVDGGPVLKRWRPRAFGRAAPIRKRTSHIIIKLGDRAEEAKSEAKAQKADGKKAKTVAGGLKAALVKTVAKKPAAGKSGEEKSEKTDAAKPAGKDKSKQGDKSKVKKSKE